MDEPTALKSRDTTPLPDVAFTVRIVKGRDANEEIGLDLSRSRVLVGTSASADLRIVDPLVSRRHVALEITGRKVRLTDLGSSNGTTVNGVEVVDVYLHGGETFTIGDTTLLVSATVARPGITLTSATNLGRMAGASVAMRRVYPIATRLAASMVPVVVEGETGTGKELLAETLHEIGPRASGPFVVIDARAVSRDADLVLFGVEGGALGVIAQAQSGTLVIDEISELDDETQGKLLRTIDRGEYVPKGSSTVRRADVRIIATSRHNLDQEVQLGRFREDLYYRLSVGRIELPPLRQRQGDVSLLANFFWRKMAPVDEVLPATFLDQLEDLAWPGNVRELMNAIARRLALGDDHETDSLASVRGARDVDVAELYERVLALDVTLPQARELIVDDFERRYVERILARFNGNVTRAAAASGLARRYFQVLRARQRGA